MFTTRDKILLAFEHPSPQSSPLSEGRGRRVRGVVSGAYLARRLGMTRASVWKHIKTLRADGFPIRTEKALGYCLTAPFDFSLLKGEAARGTRFWKFHYHFETASTQTLAKHGADQGAAEGNLWIAEKQRRGKGRLDRTWESGLGGLWMSLLLRPAIAPALVPSLTLVAALTLAESIQHKTGIPVRLKWPNDLMVETPQGWRKLAGILTEMSAEMDRVRWSVLGIGVNVNNSLPRGLSGIATSLQVLTGRTFSRAVLLKDFLERFGGAYRRFEKAGFKAFQRSYWQWYGRPDQAVRLKTSQGLVRGVARGVDARGALLIESNYKTTSIWEGEITT